MIAILGDIHLKSKEARGGVNLTTGLYRITELKLKTIDYFVWHAIDKRAEACIFEGDIFNKLNPPQYLRDLFLQAIKPLVENLIPVYIIRGNHDTDGRNSNLKEEIDLFGDKYNVTFVSEPMFIQFKHFSVCLAPYKAPVDLLIKANYLITHNGIEGGTVGFYDRPLDDVDYTISDLNNLYEKVISGHFHKPQLYTISGLDVIFTGSTTPIDFAERGEKKRFNLILNNNQIESIRFPEELAPKFLQFTFWEDIGHHEDETSTQASSSEIDSKLMSLNSSQFFENAILKIKYIGSRLWYQSINHLALHRLLKDELGVAEIIIEKDISETAVTSIDTTDLSTSQIFEEFIRTENIDSELAEIGRGLIHEAIKQED